MDDDKKEVVEETKVAPQDVPVPEADPFAFMAVWKDVHATLLIDHAHMRPDPSTLEDIRFEMTAEYTEKLGQKLVDMAWRGMKPGCSLYLPANFPAQPEVKAEKKSVKGYKQYRKSL